VLQKSAENRNHLTSLARVSGRVTRDQAYRLSRKRLLNYEIVRLLGYLSVRSLLSFPSLEDNEAGGIIITIIYLFLSIHIKDE